MRIGSLVLHKEINQAISYSCAAHSCPQSITSMLTLISSHNTKSMGILPLISKAAGSGTAYIKQCFYPLLVLAEIVNKHQIQILQALVTLEVFRWYKCYQALNATVLLRELCRLFKEQSACENNVTSCNVLITAGYSNLPSSWKVTPMVTCHPTLLLLPHPDTRAAADLSPSAVGISCAMNISSLNRRTKCNIYKRKALFPVDYAPS